MNSPNADGVKKESNAPYLQPKGELEAEERGRYEPPAEARELELDDHEIREMSTVSNQNLATSPGQELGAEEHSRELE